MLRILTAVQSTRKTEKKEQEISELPLYICPSNNDIIDLEDLTNSKSSGSRPKKKTFFAVTKKTKSSEQDRSYCTSSPAGRSWRQILGPLPSKGTTKVCIMIRTYVRVR